MSRGAPAARGAAIALALALAACARGGDDGRRLLAGEPIAGAPAGPPAESGADPAALLGQDAEAVARRLGSFAWRATVVTSVDTRADDGIAVRQVERHALRQLATGDFAVDVEVDPGDGPGGLGGAHVVRAGDMTWGRGPYAPWRERPTDRGLGARRQRAQSFGLAADLARLLGPALALGPDGEETVLGRPARRLAVGLRRDAPPAAGARPGGGAVPDEETRRHLAFLDGRVPLAASGEVLVDAATGAVLRAHLACAFGLRDDPRVRVEVEASEEVTAIGAGVAAVEPPADALPDSRKPAGVAAALEAAGLRAPPAEERPRGEPADDAEP